jgi:ABC-2 type transport system permease protein
VTSNVAAIWRHRAVLGLLVRRDLTVKYQLSVLGYMWSLIEPLTVAATYWFVFGLLFTNAHSVRDHLPYLLFLSSGLFAWIWVNGVLGDATTALTSQARLITTIRVPREVFPIGRVAGKFFEYVAALPVLVLIAIAYHGTFGVYLLLIPVAVVLQGVLLIGVSLLLASLNVMLRDVERFIRLAQRVLFYALPIVYPLSLVTDAQRIPPWFKVVYVSDPLVGIFELHHAAWTGIIPPTQLLITSVVGTMTMLVGGWWVFRSLEPSVLKEL